METILEISLYSYPYLNHQKCFSYYAYVFSSRKLEVRAEQVLPGNMGWGRWWGRGRGKK
jgi:hypothetical protein